MIYLLPVGTAGAVKRVAPIPVSRDLTLLEIPELKSPPPPAPPTVTSTVSFTIAKVLPAQEN